jgi:hypothetical protein
VSMPRQYVHPEFGVFCPTPRFRRWVRVALAGVVAGVIGIAALGIGRSPDPDSVLVAARLDDGLSAGAQVSPPPAAAIDPRTNFVGAAKITADKITAEKPACPGETWSYADGKCVASSPRKPRMVRVPTYRPAIAAVPLGRSASSAGNSSEGAPAGTANSRQSEPAKTAQAAASAAPADAAAAAGSTEPTQRAAATTKKKVAHSQRRRDPYGGWREVRVDDWYARSYAPRDYSRGYGGSYRSFW